MTYASGIPVSPRHLFGFGRYERARHAEHHGDEDGPGAEEVQEHLRDVKPGDSNPGPAEEQETEEAEHRRECAVPQHALGAHPGRRHGAAAPLKPSEAWRCSRSVSRSR